MTDDADLAARFGDSVETAIQERHEVSAEPLSPKVRRKATKLTRAQIWDPASKIRGILGTGKAYSPEDICRLTALMPEQCGAALCKLEGEGVVRRVGDGWEMIFI